MIRSKALCVPLALAMVLVFTSCEDDNGGDGASGNPKYPPLPATDDAGEVLKAPRSINFGGETVMLTTFLNRDFMPICPPDGRPLMAVVKVVNQQGKHVELPLEMDHIWIVKDRQEVWHTNFAADQRSYKFEKVARDGPKWEPGIAVDVVVRLVEADGKPHLLRAIDQKIMKSE